MDNNIKKNIKVYVGGKESVQRRSFIVAKAGFTGEADFEELSIEDLCRVQKFTAI
jgi:hypothetical protein